MTLGHRFLPFVGPLDGATEATDTLPFFPHSRSILDQDFLNTEYLSILRVLPPDGQHRESAVRRSNLPTRGSWAADCSAVTSSGPIEQRAGAISKSALDSGFWWPSPRRPSRAPALPRGAVRGCSYRGGSDFRHRRQILGQDTCLMGDCERSERLEPAAGGKFF